MPISNTSAIGGFIATSNFAEIWEFLGLEETSTLTSLKERAKAICEMDAVELAEYNDSLDKPVHENELFQFCFRSVFTFEMLYTGYGFPLDYEITAVDTLNNQKLGWALGSILYEINTLPWDFGGKFKIKSVDKLGMSLPSLDADGGTFHSLTTVYAVACTLVIAFLSSKLLRPRRNEYQEIPSVSSS